MAGNNSDWKSVLKSQHDDLERLAAMDAALDEEKITKNIDSILKKPVNSVSRVSNIPRASPTTSRKHDSVIGENNKVDLSFGSDNSNDNIIYSTNSSRQIRNRPNSGNKITSKDTMSIDPGSPGSSTLTPREPLANAKYLKAREKLLQKQVEDGVEIRKHLNEQVSDLQKQLKVERDENKNLKKRVQILEVENKRQNASKNSDNSGKIGNETNIDILTQEISSLKKDLLTAERIAKQGDANVKAKDTQLKRALETITRLKSQLGEIQQKVDGEDHTDRTKFDSLESKLRIVEKQRNDLLIAFKKQMKLIDVLKRQKVHIEAARLLAFTEEEFVKTLDWAV